MDKCLFVDCERIEEFHGFRYLAVTGALIFNNAYIEGNRALRVIFAKVQEVLIERLLPFYNIFLLPGRQHTAMHCSSKVLLLWNL